MRGQHFCPFLQVKKTTAQRGDWSTSGWGGRYVSTNVPLCCAGFRGLRRAPWITLASREVFPAWVWVTSQRRRAGLGCQGSQEEHPVLQASQPPLVPNWQVPWLPSVSEATACPFKAQTWAPSELFPNGLIRFCSGCRSQRAPDRARKGGHSGQGATWKSNPPHFSASF